MYKSKYLLIYSVDPSLKFSVFYVMSLQQLQDFAPGLRKYLVMSAKPRNGIQSVIQHGAAESSDAKAAAEFNKNFYCLIK